MTHVSLSNIERQQKILTFLSRQQRISVNEICEMFTVSEATARRDLEVLTDQNHLQRVHGGAISLRQAPPELPILQRETEQSEEKRRIAIAATNLVEDGDTVFLGSGTTVLEVARILRDRKGLTIISNSLPVMNLLSGLQEITLIALGGVLRDCELSFIGHITEQALAEIRADKVIIGIHAIAIENGLTNDYLQETMTDRAILRSGKEVIVVADHTKINTVSIAYLAPVTSIHKLITDQQTPDDFISALIDKGVAVVVV
jgi:DeoR/GlpR family transcriptional regulator of sugar metabolism